MHFGGGYAARICCILRNRLKNLKDGFRLSKQLKNTVRIYLTRFVLNMFCPVFCWKITKYVVDRSWFVIFNETNQWF